MPQQSQTPEAIRQRRRKGNLDAAGLKPYRGSTAFHPEEHAAVCAVVEWIKAQRGPDGSPGNLAPLREALDHRASGKD